MDKKIGGKKMPDSRTRGPAAPAVLVIYNINIKYMDCNIYIYIINNEIQMFLEKIIPPQKKWVF